MAYAQYFSVNFHNNNTEEVRGTCHTMCPEDEIKLREDAKMVHQLEVIHGEKKLVKSYSRSAADATMAVPRLLRPYRVLKDTVEYLLFEITKQKKVPIHIMYDFVDDRLRAVRQDMTIQRLPADECCNLLEPMVRFYVYYGYKLCELPISEFDPVLNGKHLLECLKWYLSCCDHGGNKQTNDDLANIFTGLTISHNKSRLCNDRVLMESLYLLCNLDDVHPLLRYLNLPKDLKSEPKLVLAYKIAIANMKGNYIRCCKLSHRLCLLTHCAFALYLSTLQRRAFQVMSTAYSSKALTIPCEVLRRWLRFNSTEEVRAACTHYGLTVHDDAVRFSKTEFRRDAATLPPKKLLSADLNLN